MYGVGFNSAFGEERPGPAPLIPAPLCHPRPPHRHMQKRTHTPAKRERERDITSEQTTGRQELLDRGREGSGVD